MSKLRVFVSSVQKEMEIERIAIASLITTDPWLLQHCEPVLFEKEPAPARKSKQPYLKCLESCQIYLVLIHKEYGKPDGALSATHHEYRHAQKLGLPSLIFIKGENPVDEDRAPETKAFFAEIRTNKHTYKRFLDRLDLRAEVRRALLKLLKDDFQIEPSSGEAAGGKELIEAASAFESTPLNDVHWKSLDEQMVGAFAAKVVEGPGSRVFDEPVFQALHSRGLLWRRGEKGDHFATAAGFLLFGVRPGDRYPQCEILVDAYAETKISGKPRGQHNINAALPKAINQILEFVDKHTFHPTRVVGINNITLDEYPERALREALVNAVAHRNYEDASRKIGVQIFSDRIVVASPGYPPSPLTLAKLRRGNYRPCSRNSVIAQALATMNLMEQRGSGFARMRDTMLNHGLDAPLYAQQDGYFVVSFYGPNGNYDRLKASADAVHFITPAVEAQLNERQKKIMVQVQREGLVTSGWCRTAFDITYDTANRDLLDLVERKLLVKVGRGRSTHFRVKSLEP
ncbi:MAG TPA: ATP-binding protein [Verrucomicrobiae bacterium]|jgi:predicted HTH transcriptional regulator